MGEPTHGRSNATQSAYVHCFSFWLHDRDASYPSSLQRRRCSMKGRMVFVALLMSVALCSQGFGFELLDNMLGLNRGCTACDPACCSPACCDPAVKCCTPEPACCKKVACCDPVCKPNCCDPCCKPCDLFSGLRGLFACKRCCDPGCDNACCPEAKCCAPEPKCCDPCCKPKRCCKPRRCCKPKCCEAPACCEKPACCDPCGKARCRRCCTPVLDFLDDLFCCRSKCCCKPKCCDPGCCEEVAGTCCGCGVEVTPAKAAPAEKAAPLPAPAPKADPSASLYRSRNVRQASRNVTID